MSRRPQLILALALVLAGGALFAITQTALGFVCGLLLIFGGGAMAVRPHARYRDREPSLPRWLNWLSHGKGEYGTGPEIFIGEGRIRGEDDDPDREQTRRDRSD